MIQSMFMYLISQFQNILKIILICCAKFSCIMKNSCQFNNTSQFWKFTGILRKTRNISSMLLHRLLFHNLHEPVYILLFPEYLFFYFSSSTPCIICLFFHYSIFNFYVFLLYFTKFITSVQGRYRKNVRFSIFALQMRYRSLFTW